MSSIEEKPDIRWALISWWPHSRRSEAFARTLGGKLHCIYYLKSRERYLAPLRYVLQGIHTLWVLFRDRPQAVHVQNPPFVCSLMVFLYSSVTNSRYVIDHHSAAFSSVWRWASPIQKLLARRAVTNVVTNQHWEEIIQSWGAHGLIMGDPFLSLQEGSVYQVSQGFNVAFICTFSLDEPVDEVLKAAAELTGVHFYITGDVQRKHKSFFSELPDNVTFTGFLPDDQYIGLLRSVAAILVLTKRDHTLQLGGCEAVSVGQPLLTSNWPFLREFFPRGTIYVDNTSDSIRQGVLTMQKEHKRLKEEMILFRSIARNDWDNHLFRLNEIVREAIC